MRAALEEKRRLGVGLEGGWGKTLEKDSGKRFANRYERRGGGGGGAGDREGEGGKGRGTAR